MSFTAACEQEYTAKRWREQERVRLRRELHRVADEVMKAVFYGQKEKAAKLLDEQRYIFARAQEIKHELPTASV